MSLSVFTAFLLALSGLTGEHAAPVAEHDFDISAMDHLSFLEGRWVGTAPDGRLFYDVYDRQDETTLRSLRHKDATFAEVIDSSSVTFRDGQVISIWGDFTWRATSIEYGHAVFAPVEAPSTFTWTRIDADNVEVKQMWRDEANVPQSYALRLTRLR